MSNALIIRNFKRSPYEPLWHAMQTFSHQRTADTTDELWLLEHEPVFTQGKAGKPEHVLNPHGIPIVQTDRGGQVTYHGPGQLMAYTLFDIQRLGLNTRDFVVKIEHTIIDFLKQFTIEANGDRDAPGVYVDGAKICSIGLRVRQGRSYHGIALNVAMDLTPFRYINPCGFAGLKMAQIKDFQPDITLQYARDQLAQHFVQAFNYQQTDVMEMPHEQITHL